MALTKCHECGHDVSTQANACPTCGAQAKKPSGTRLGLFLLAVLGPNPTSLSPGAIRDHWALRPQA
jgi:hypothetical protein